MINVGIVQIVPVLSVSDEGSQMVNKLFFYNFNFKLSCTISFLNICLSSSSLAFQNEHN